MNFGMQNGHFAYVSPLEGLRGNEWCSSYAHWKAYSGLLISDNWTFLSKCYSWSTTSEYRLKIGVLKGVGQLVPTFQVEGDISHQ